MRFLALHKLRGFTLIELLITVVIVGILSAVAYPSYLEHVRKAHRAEVTGLLLQNAHRLERHFARQGSYLEGGAAKSGPGCAGLPFAAVERGAGLRLASHCGGWRAYGRRSMRQLQP